MRSMPAVEKLRFLLAGAAPLRRATTASARWSMKRGDDVWILLGSGHRLPPFRPAVALYLSGGAAPLRRATTASARWSMKRGDDVWILLGSGHRLALCRLVVAVFLS